MIGIDVRNIVTSDCVVCGVQLACKQIYKLVLMAMIRQAFSLTLIVKFKIDDIDFMIDIHQV